MRKVTVANSNIYVHKHNTLNIELRLRKNFHLFIVNQL